jgi:DNA-binding response OmpR family regulator
MELPVIMATGRLPTDEFDRYPWLKPVATLIKPYATAEMLSTVKTVLHETDAADAPAKRPKTLPHRILVVDEDRDLRQLYAEGLARPGYHVDVAEDGVAGWEALQVHHYHLLITEHDLPDLSGIELIRKLRAARMALPVVMAASRLPTEELDQNPSLQLAATLAKPFALDALLDTVTSILRATDRPGAQTDAPPNSQSQPSTVALKL